MEISVVVENGMPPLKESFPVSGVPSTFTTKTAGWASFAGHELQVKTNLVIIWQAELILAGLLQRTASFILPA